MKTRIPLEEAWLDIKENIKPINETIELSIFEANGYVIAEDIVSAMCLPPYNKSAVDGYALNYEDTLDASKEQPMKFKVIDTVNAGDYSDQVIGKCEAINIMTGGEVPESCNAVIRQEWTNDDINSLEVYHSVVYFDNICKKGEDVEPGDVLIHKGETLDFARLGIISSLGKDKVTVYRKPRIALCVSGDEIVAPGNLRPRGKIYESNMALLYAHMQDMHYTPYVTKYIPDDAKTCADILLELSKQCDAIITTGAVSVGKKDIFHEALDLAGANKVFWRVILKPGTPAIFSMLGDVPIMSLSGNPFAALSTFDMLARPLVEDLTLDHSLRLEKTNAILTNEFKKKSGTRRFIRGIYEQGKVIIPSGIHSSNALRSLIGCNCFIDVPAGSGPLHENDTVQVWLL